MITKGKKIAIASLIVILLIITYGAVQLLGFTEFMRGRNICDKFSPKEYNFEGVLLKISNEECKIKDGKQWVFYELTFENPELASSGWRLSDFRVTEGDVAASVYFDTLVDVWPSKVWNISETRSIKLYTVLDEQSAMLTVTSSGLTGAR